MPMWEFRYLSDRHPLRGMIERVFHECQSWWRWRQLGHLAQNYHFAPLFFKHILDALIYEMVLGFPLEPKNLRISQVLDTDFWDALGHTYLDEDAAHIFRKIVQPRHPVADCLSRLSKYPEVQKVEMWSKSRPQVQMYLV